MKIAIFTDTFLPQVNGVTNTLKRLGDYFEFMNIEYIFVIPDQKNEGLVPYNMESFFSTPFVFYPECRITLPNMVRLNKRMATFEPDVILLMTEFTVGLSGLMYGKKYGIPVISNYSTNFNTILKSYKLKVLEKPLDKYISWFHNEANMTVTPSKESEKILHRLGVIKTGVFGRGIDYDRFSPEKRSIKLRQQLGIEHKIVLLYVGRVSAEKDLDVLRSSMIALNEKYKDEIALIITGDGPMKSELERTMPKNVIFTGYKKGEALSEIYASADIFAFPSSFETFGNVVLESFASGLPVVGVNEGGVVDIINHGSTGYLAESKNPESFTFFIEKLINNDIERKYFGINARIYAATKSWNVVFDKLLLTLHGTYSEKSNIS